MQDDGFVGLPFMLALEIQFIDHSSKTTCEASDAAQDSPPREPGGSFGLDRSTDFEVVCRFLPAIAHDFILNDLPLVEGAQPRALDCRNVDEHVLKTPLAGGCRKHSSAQAASGLCAPSQ
jgi:hypothetical protein